MSTLDKVMYRALLRSCERVDANLALRTEDRFWNTMEEEGSSGPSLSEVRDVLGDAIDLLEIHMCNRPNHGNMERSYIRWKDMSNEEILNEIARIHGQTY